MNTTENNIAKDLEVIALTKVISTLEQQVQDNDTKERIEMFKNLREKIVTQYTEMHNRRIKHE